MSYIREKNPLLQQINWTINPGEHWAILGLNGAGKTLLLQIITGNLWPSKGKVTVLGEVFGQTSIPELSKRIGWVSTALQVRLRMNETAENIVLSGKFASIGLYQHYTLEELQQALYTNSIQDIPRERLSFERSQDLPLLTTRSNLLISVFGSTPERALGSDG